MPLMFSRPAARRLAQGVFDIGPGRILRQIGADDHFESAAAPATSADFPRCRVGSGNGREAGRRWVCQNYWSLLRIWNRLAQLPCLLPLSKTRLPRQRRAMYLPKYLQELSLQVRIPCILAQSLGPRGVPRPAPVQVPKLLVPNPSPVTICVNAKRCCTVPPHAAASFAQLIKINGFPLPHR